MSIFDLSPTKRALLERLRRERGSESPDPIRPLPPGAPRVLSFGQQRLWFLESLEPGSPSYNMPGAVRLHGRFDVAVLERAMNGVVRRHEVLRSAFNDANGRPIVQLRDEAELRIAFVDLTSAPQLDRMAEVRARAAVEARTPFDLTLAPLVRGTLLRLSEEDHVLLVTMHHIVADGWSIAVFVRETSLLYAIHSGRSAPALPELPIQYADYAAWQVEALSGPRLAAQVAYWRETLRAAPAVSTLPADRPRPTTPSYRGSHLPVELAPEVLVPLRALARDEGATLFMVLLAGFAVLLARHSHQRDLVIGTPIAGRSRSETADLIGFFVNTLPLRVGLHAAPSFRDVVRRVKQVALGGFSNQDVPFELLVQELAPERDSSRLPLLQVVFALQNAPALPLALDGLRVELEELGTGTSKFDLTLVLGETDGGLSGSIEYSTDLFDASTIRRLADHLQTLLTAAGGAPDAPALELPMLGTEERRRMLVDWNQTAFEHDRAGSLHGLFEAAARRTPDAVAVASSRGSLTYRALDMHAATLAARLRASGARPGDRVAVCAERSAELVLGVLAVLKAGAAYVPLDPAYPAERLGFMVTDASIATVLTTTKLAPLLEHTGARIIVVDETRGSAAPSSTPAVAPHGLAYVIYTSGSTGRPKGVAVAHASAVNLVEWNLRTHALGPADRATLIASPSFDASIWELWPVLAAGGTIDIPDDDVRASPGDLLEWLDVHQITCFFAPTPLAEALLQQMTTSPRCLRWMGAGGDSLRRRPSADATFTLENLYGPTECTVVTTSEVVLAEPDRPSPSIGRPIDNVRVYTLDARMEPVPIGSEGELFVAGVGLAWGYLNRPGETADRFVPDPFGRTGGRLYRTGDRTRHLEDGRLECLGRVDTQVKVHGYRIEPSEIEAILGTHAQVRESAVVVRDGGGGKRLVAYLVGSGEPRPQVADLRAWLKQRLPEFLVPAAFVWLDRLPSTPNGKLDRKSLPVREDDAAGDRVADEPRSPTEKLVASTWCEVLDIARVGRNDDFFAIGGHSLLATQVASRLRAAFGTDLPLRTLFQATTIAELAERIDAAMATSASGGLRPPTPTPLTDPPTLSFGQERLWFLDQLEPGSAFYNIAGAIRIVGPLDVTALETALARVVSRHEVLRWRFPIHEGEARPFVAVEQQLDFEVADLDGAGTDVEAREAIAARVRRPFALADQAPVRAALLRSHDGHVLVLSMHHIVADGWSLGIVIRETIDIYGSLTTGTAVDLRPLPLRYADYAHWQRRLVDDGALDSQLAHWGTRLQGAPSALELPLDRARPAVQTFRGKTLTFAVPPRLTQSLRMLAQSEGVTLYMLLLAAFDTFLARFTGVSDIVVGTPIANRTRREFEGVVGFFVNTLALRVDLTGQPAFTELLQRVKAVALDAYSHQDVPFERLVEHLSPPRDLARTPVFQHFFALQDQLRLDLGLSGSRMSVIATESGTAKFDLSLTFTDRSDHLEGALEYATDLFEDATATRYAASLSCLLESIVADPLRSISEMPLLREEERLRLIQGHNDTAITYQPSTHLHGLVEEQVARTPDAIALVFEDAQLTYRELDARANQLAHHLIRRGVRPDHRVGVALHRSLELPVVLLAIMKAGGAYLPLDPEYPADRLRFIVEDGECAVVVTDASLATIVSMGTAEVVLLDAEAAAIEAEPSHSPALELSPSHAAYVIFTSGSTGRPKGVAVPHGGICNRLLWMQAEYRLGADDVVLQKTPYSFDVSVWEFFWPWLAGARLVVAVAGGHRDTGYLARTIAEYGVTTLHFVPSMGRAFVEEPGLEDLTSVRRIMFSGEALTSDLVQGFLQRMQAELHNLYGPTEASVDVTAWHCTQATTARPAVPIGRPVANTTTYVVDRFMETQPSGVAGELLLGGVQLARGYLSRPALTADRFVPDPFAVQPGARLYRTGDIARWSSDGALDYLGRSDHQVKIRGFRIELDEIKVQLLGHGSVREAAVIAHRSRAGAQSLVAYVVPAQGPLDVQRLREHLGRTLPDYMVPSTIIALEALPLTTSGKLDANALPAPGMDARRSVIAFVDPRTEEERRLAEAWKAVLKVDRIGIDDNVFDRGADSILAIRFRARAAAAGLEFSVQDVFKHQTIRRLAAAVSSEQVSLPGSGTMPFSLVSQVDRARLPPGLEDAYPLSRVLAGLVFHSEYSPDYLVYSYSMHLRAQIDATALRAAAARVLERHPILRSSFDLDTFSEPMHLVHRSATIPVVEEDLRAMDGDAQERWIVNWVDREQRVPFDWSRAPMLRLHLHRRSNTTFQFTLTQPFLDGWSAASLLAELAREVFAAHDALPAPTASFRDFVALERAAIASPEQRAFWTRKLHGRHVFRLPKRSPGTGDVDLLAVRRIEVPIAAETSARLRTLARDAEVPLKDVCLAAHLKTLQVLSGSGDVVTGVLFNGRPEQPDGDRILGLFLNPVPFRVQLQPGTWIDLVRQVMQEEIEVLPFRRFPLVEIQRGGEPLFDVLFNFIHFHVLDALDELRDHMTPISWDYGTDQDYVPMIVRFAVDHATARLSLHLEYRTAQLEESEIVRIAGYYAAVLSAMTSNAAGSLHEAEGLPAASVVHAGQEARESAAHRHPYVAPRTETETMLASMWSELLVVERVGVDDDFFALGGHSLIATRVATRLRRDAGIDIPVGAIFENSTVAALARLLDSRPAAPGPSGAPIARRERQAHRMTRRADGALVSPVTPATPDPLVVAPPDVPKAARDDE